MTSTHIDSLLLKGRVPLGNMYSLRILKGKVLTLFIIIEGKYKGLPQERIGSLSQFLESSIVKGYPPKTFLHIKAKGYPSETFLCIKSMGISY